MKKIFEMGWEDGSRSQLHSISPLPLEYMFLPQRTLLTHVKNNRYLTVLWVDKNLNFVSNWLDIASVITVDSVALAVGISSFIGIVLGIYPTARAVRLNPIDVLRYE